MEIAARRPSEMDRIGERSSAPLTRLPPANTPGWPVSKVRGLLKSQTVGVEFQSDLVPALNALTHSRPRQNLSEDPQSRSLCPRQC